MKRINVYIKEETDRDLDNLSEMLGVSRSEVFRDAVNAYRTKHESALADFTVGLIEPVIQSSNQLSVSEIETINRCSDFKTFVNELALFRGLDGITKIKLRDYQEYVFEEIDLRRYIVINKSRQIGITLLMQLYALHTALYNSDKTIVWSSYNLACSKDALNGIKEIYEHLPDYFKTTCIPIENNKTTLKFENGSRIFAVTTNASSVRGMTINLLISDEFAYVSRMEAEGFMDSVLPVMLSSKVTKTIFMSSPNGYNHFYDICTRAKSNKNPFYYIELPFTVIPNRDLNWMLESIKRIGIANFMREYMCVFKSLDEDVISPINNRIHIPIGASDVVVALVELLNSILMKR